MKKFLTLTLAALALLCGCNKSAEDKDGGEDVSPAVKLEITDLKDNCATITATLTQGQFHGGKIIVAKKVSSIDIDYTNEIKLIQYVRTNGTDIDKMPYTTTVENLTYEKDYFTAVIVFDKDGRATGSKYETWTAQGTPDGISDKNSAGELGNNDIN